MSAAAAATGVSRPHLSATLHAGPRRRRGRPPKPDDELVAAIGALIADLPTYGYRRVHALLRREAEAIGRAAPNPKRVYRVMMAALRAASEYRQPPVARVHYLGRGSRHAAEAYRRVLADHSNTGSASRRGNRYDNASAENFTVTLKVEAV